MIVKCLNQNESEVSRMPKKNETVTVQGTEIAVLTQQSSND